jgi:hypothetical protein
MFGISVPNPISEADKALSRLQKSATGALKGVSPQLLSLVAKADPVTKKAFEAIHKATGVAISPAVLEDKVISRAKAQVSDLKAKLGSLHSQGRARVAKVERDRLANVSRTSSALAASENSLKQIEQMLTKMDPASRAKFQKELDSESITMAKHRKAVGIGKPANVRSRPQSMGTLVNGGR